MFSNYRIFVDRDRFLIMHKVITDKDNNIIGFEEYDCNVEGKSLLELREEIERMTWAFNKPWIDKENFPEVFKRAKFKFNGGKGAILCSGCNVIIKENLSDEEFEDIGVEGKVIPAMYCEQCKEK